MQSSNQNIKVLVTGGTGFLAAHLILQLLQQDYSVRATLRDHAKKEELLNALRTEGMVNHAQLEFIEADLTDDHNWPVLPAFRRVFHPRHSYLPVKPLQRKHLNFGNCF